MSAALSLDRLYRYDLWRNWGPEVIAPGSYAMFIGLNPSTADEINDDPTIRRCIAYSKAWGYQALCMANIFAFRATDPKDMMKADGAVGYENNAYLLRHAMNAGVVVACWGAHGSYLSRGNEVARLIPNLQALAVTKGGYPGHPLYLKKDLVPFPYGARP